MSSQQASRRENESCAISEDAAPNDITFNRRDALKAVMAGAAAAALGAAPGMQASAFAAGTTAFQVPANVLVFLKMCDLPAADTTPDRIGQIKDLLVSLGKANNFNVTVITDGPDLTAASIAANDAVIFYSTGNLSADAGPGAVPMTDGGRTALFKAIAAGKGILVMQTGLRPRASATAAAATAPDPFTTLTSSLKLLGANWSTIGSSSASVIKILNTGARTGGRFIGTVPLPLQMIALYTGAGKTKAPLLSAMFATTSPLLRAALLA